MSDNLFKKIKGFPQRISHRAHRAGKNHREHRDFFKTLCVLCGLFFSVNSVGKDSAPLRN